MQKGYWYVISVDLGNGKGIDTLATAENIDEIKQEVRELHNKGENRPMLINRWLYNTGNVDETFKTIVIQSGIE